MFIRNFSALHLRYEPRLTSCQWHFERGPGYMKISSSVYKGIQYVQVSSLPAEQRERLLGTINSELFIKILVDGKILGNCLQFKDYEKWFENVYRGTASAEDRSSVVSAEAKLVQVAPTTTSN